MALTGPFQLSEIWFRVEADTMGVYALHRNGYVAYVGRSDTDLPKRIRESSRDGHYSGFSFDYASSPMDAYKYECELFHEFNPPDNLSHPGVPPDTNWRCPIVGCRWS